MAYSVLIMNFFLFQGYQQTVSTSRVTRCYSGEIGGTPLQRNENTAPYDTGDGKHQRRNHITEKSTEVRQMASITTALISL